MNEMVSKGGEEEEGRTEEGRGTIGKRDDWKGKMIRWKGEEDENRTEE